MIVIKSLSEKELLTFFKKVMSRPLRECNLALNSGEKSKIYFSRSKFLMMPEWRGSNWFPATPVALGWHIFCVYYSPGSATEIALASTFVDSAVVNSSPVTIFSFLRIKPVFFTATKSSSVHAEEEQDYDRPSTSSGPSGSSMGSTSSVSYDPRKPQVKSKWADTSILQKDWGISWEILHINLKWDSIIFTWCHA